MTETAHPSIDFGASMFKSLVWDNALEAALTVLFAEAPALNIPIVRSIVRGIARMISDSFFSLLKEFVDMAAIPIMNAELKSKFDGKYSQLRFVLIKNGMDSPEFKAAHEEAHDAFADFFRNNATRVR